MKALLPLLLVTFLFAGCALPEETGLRQETSSINGGYAEPGEPGVVLIWHNMGYMCTGTLIKPTIVITAKHCVRDLDSGYDYPVYGFHVGVGPDMYSVVQEYGVDDVITYSGVEIEDEDVALLILDQAVPESVATPYPIVVSVTGDDALTVSETLLTIIGYGESICGEENNAGVKLRTEDLFLGYYTTGGDFVTQGRGANHGDSGGPVFTPDMKLVGVTSRGSDVCTGEEAGITIAASVAHHNDFIGGVLEGEGYCAPTANSDICDDGEDNDCNGYVDDACLQPGELCTENWECANGLCYNQGTESRCIKTCDPYVTSSTCGSGHYCKPQGCGEVGICAPGAVGTKAFLEQCNADTECGSLFCSDSGDGISRCLYPCEFGADHCLMEEVCVTTSQGCGACIPSESGPQTGRSMGEPCTDGTQCLSGYCHPDALVHYCSTTCSSQSPCSEGFHCADGACEKGPVGQMGDPCTSNADCGGGLQCADFGTGIGHCSTDCSDGAECEEAGYFCASANNGQFCKTSGVLKVGDDCSNATCETGLFCVEAAAGSFRCAPMCSRYESEGCPAATGCYETNRTYCLPFNAEPDSGNDGDGKGWFGCSTSQRTGDGPLPLSVPLMALLLVTLVAIRRNR